jgi:hypothetical protein
VVDVVDDELSAAASCAVLSSVRVCFASDRLVRASSTELFRSVGSREAINCPALTVSPILTFTAATVPDTGKEASVRSASLNDPAAATF